MRMNYLRSLALVILVVLAISSCASPLSSRVGKSDFQCLDVIGCLDLPPGEPLHIAYALVLSGQQEALGIDAHNAIEIAAADKAQILDREILLSGEDERCNPEGGLTASTKLAADPTIIAVIGPSCSEAAWTAVPVLSQAGLLIISPSNSDYRLTQEGQEIQYPGYARTAPNEIFEGKAAAEFAHNLLKARKVATIQDGSSHAEILEGIFVEVFEQLGGTVTSREIINPSETNFIPLLTRFSSGDPDLIYYPISVQLGSLITLQAREIPALENTALLGSDDLFSQEIVKIAGDAVKGVYVSNPDHTLFNETYASDFLPKYMDRYGTDPINSYHAFAYDAFMLIADTIEKVAIQDDDGTLHIPRQALREALYATKDHRGITGNLSCTPTGDCTDSEIAIYQYQLGAFPPEKIWP